MNDKPGYCDHDGTQVGMPCPFCGRLNMNPTSPTPKTHAEVAKKLWKRLLDADVDACNPDCDDQTRGPVAILTTALRDAAIQAREDHVKACGLEFVMGHPDFRIAAPKGFVLDDSGNVRRVLPFNANGKLIGYIFAENENFMQFTLTNLNLHAKDAHAGEKGAANGK